MTRWNCSSELWRFSWSWISVPPLRGNLTRVKPFWVHQWFLLTLTVRMRDIGIIVNPCYFAHKRDATIVLRLGEDDSPSLTNWCRYYYNLMIFHLAVPKTSPRLAVRHCSTMLEWSCPSSRSCSHRKVERAIIKLLFLLFIYIIFIFILFILFYFIFLFFYFFIFLFFYFFFNFILFIFSIYITVQCGQWFETC